MKKECSEFDRAVRLTRIKVWLQKRFWKWVNDPARKIESQLHPFVVKVEKYAITIRYIDKELGNIIWLEGYKKRQKEG